MTKTIMAMTLEKTIPISSVQRQSPIEFLTENDFSIIRLGDLNRSTHASGKTHEFLVRDPNGYELQITVQISNGAVAEVAHRCRGRITPESLFWIALAERHLADYLWEADDYPPDARLTVEELTIDDIDLARRWGCEG